jgi:hypothetical protein
LRGIEKYIFSGTKVLRRKNPIVPLEVDRNEEDLHE